MKVAAGLNSCLKRDQAWTGSSACAQVPLLGQPGSSPAAGGRGVPWGATHGTVPAACEAGVLCVLLLGRHSRNSCCLPVKWDFTIFLACCC